MTRVLTLVTTAFAVLAFVWASNRDFAELRRSAQAPVFLLACRTVTPGSQPDRLHRTERFQLVSAAAHERVLRCQLMEEVPCTASLCPASPFASQ